MFTIDDLREGKCVVINDGTVQELAFVLNKAWPCCNRNLGGCFKYYRGCTSLTGWYGTDVTGYPAQSVKDFLTNNIKTLDLKVTPEQVKKAAETSTEAKKALKELFPKVFEDEEYFDLSSMRCRDIVNTPLLKQVGLYPMIEVRLAGNLNNKGFYLSESQNWEIVTDDLGKKVLLPTKKI